MRVIDGDGHVMEPMSAWDSVPEEHRPRVTRDSYGLDHVLEPTLPALVPHVGEDRVVWGSDYPHHDSTFPGAIKKLRDTIAPLDAAVQAKFLGDNARALYRLP
jgi:predicted TIM-barrel fold metal-dependent hydrolase